MIKRKYLALILFTLLVLLVVYSTNVKRIELHNNKIISVTDRTIQNGQDLSILLWNLNGEITIPYEYAIEKLENNTWKSIDILDPDEAWPAIRAPVSQLGTYKQVINSDKLSSGKYRFIKQIELVDLNIEKKVEIVFLVN